MTETWDIKMLKPIVLTIIAHYFPRYKSGGSVRTSAKMVAQMDDDLDFRVIRN